MNKKQLKTAIRLANETIHNQQDDITYLDAEAEVFTDIAERATEQLQGYLKLIEDHQALLKQYDALDNSFSTRLDQYVADNRRLRKKVNRLVWTARKVNDLAPKTFREAKRQARKQPCA